MAALFKYSDIDNMPENLIKVEYDVDKKTGTVKGFKKPAKKKCVIEQNGHQFEVVSKAQRTLTTLWEDSQDHGYDYYYYDPETLLDLCVKNGIPAEGYTHDGTGVRIDHPTNDLFWGPNKTDVDKLDEETIDKRIRVFVHILTYCCEEEIAKEILVRATKKKNGTLHKGRILTIAHMNLTNEEGDTYVAVAKNDSDTKISIEVRKVGVNSTWLYEPDLLTSTGLFFG